MPNITKRFVDSLTPGAKDAIYWDDAIKGFGIKVTPKGKKIYLYKYRSPTKVQRRAALGTHGSITCENARNIAQEWAYEASKGGDPAATKKILNNSPTVSELSDRFMAEHVQLHKKPKGIELDCFYIEKYIKPLIGSLKVASVSRTDIAKFHHGMKDTPAQANRILATLSKMFNLAERWGLRPDHSNPVRNIDKFPEKPRERFLSTEEVRNLLSTLDTMEAEQSESIYMIALVRLLILTGARLREVMHAKWEWVDLDKGMLRLPDSKTGKRTIQLSPPAVHVLTTLPKVEDNPYIIVGHRKGQPMVNARKPWLRIRERANLEDVRLHDLRHSYAALCIEAGIPIYHVGKLLGHTQARTTERYAHLAEDPIKEAAALVGSRLEVIRERAHG